MSAPEPSRHGLPYADAKPVGAADFYFAINATFRFVKERFGREGLYAYWAELGSDYQRPVWQRWRTGGFTAVAEYWRAFFAAEPGADVTVTQRDNDVQVDVRRCPAIAHLRAHRREIVPEYCQHCVVMGNACAARAGLAVDVAGGNGSCRQTFRPADGRWPDPAGVASCGSAPAGVS
ncbi:MAG: hypothetical protein LBH76_01000 [Propionibacteriaceae bacterium]|jgi:hypothetical protein|nr:hypothetical protein [Propionibacteriaceae bacterium]